MKRGIPVSTVQRKSISDGYKKGNNYNHGFNYGNENAQKGVKPETTKELN